MYMKGNRELDDLLLSYLLKELNAEEEAFVEAFIHSDELRKKHFEELQKTWKAITIKKGLEQVNVEEEWEVFEQRKNRDQQKMVVVKSAGANEGISEVMQQPVPEEGREIRTRKLFVSIVAAASLLAVVVAVWISVRKPGTGGEAPPVAKMAPPAGQPELKRIANSTGRPEQLLMPDGSVVVLADKSEISYVESFTTEKRDVFLKGRADFTVAQDKARPFTVYSSDLATTVLGTVFTVSAFEDAENIVIRLSSGKVVVKPVKGGNGGLKQDYYLQPGQELIYNNKSYTAKVQYSGKRRNGMLAASRKAESDSDMPDIPENRKGSWYMFNNESLEQVFDQLKLLYNTEIVYSKKDVYNLYFAGKFDKSDSLYMILSQIASVNNLKVYRKDNKFIVAK